MNNAGNTPQGRQAGDMLARLEASLKQQQESGGGNDEQIKKYEQLVEKNPGNVKSGAVAALILRKKDNQKAKKQVPGGDKTRPAQRERSWYARRDIR